MEVIGLIMALAIVGQGVPTVPLPPSPPAQTGVRGDVLDSIFLGGAFRKTREANEHNRWVAYKFTLERFFMTITPEELAQIIHDPEQSKSLTEGLAYIKAYNPRDGREAPETTSAEINDVKVYSPSECIGAVVNGICHGSILPQAAYHPTCHGQMLNGICTGPMF